MHSNAEECYEVISDGVMVTFTSIHSKLLDSQKLSTYIFIALPTSFVTLSVLPPDMSEILLIIANIQIQKQIQSCLKELLIGRVHDHL